jgi:hypothetical protein
LSSRRTSLVEEELETLAGGLLAGLVLALDALRSPPRSAA